MALLSLRFSSDACQFYDQGYIVSSRQYRCPFFSLRQICLPTEEPYTPLNHFTQTSLQNVTSLILHNTFPYDPTHRYLSHMITTCRLLPRVRYVTIHSISLQELNRYLTTSFSPATSDRPDLRQLPPSVHTVAFWFRQANATTRVWRVFCRTLRLIHGEGIEVIRFRTEMAEDLRSRPAAYTAVDSTLQVKGWRLEAGDIYI
ncbi:hypothetical protein BDP27DRAFT_229802 [Rhodocollybia butyracea]|uniref:Uncharacterized protein n=1 Tax=Rhodocollybia butyracea TaxID=206335 RepID=A0A9P5PKI7_9AGAR|nr:hypothetical protein BDP27DRAFT_229802 [Rhodocollybia butyracea]